MSYLPRIAEAYASIELSREELTYYARHLLLPGIGAAGQRKLKTARVLVVGAGGLGCPVLQALAGAGVGRLTVVDGDRVAASNLSRQWLHRYADAGQNKALSARESLCELNPYIEVVAQSNMLNPENADGLIRAHDLVVDATDDLDVRYWIDDACAQADIPWVHAALYRERAQLTVFWARCGATFRKLYPEPGAAPSCAGAGMLGATASVVGHLQALECVKLITGNALPKVGCLVMLNAEGLALQSFQLPEAQAPTRLEDSPVELSKHGVSVEGLKQALSIHEPLQLVDLRSRDIFEADHIEGAVHCPAELILESGLPEREAPRVVLVCQEGSLSELLAVALQGRDHVTIQHLEGGFAAWKETNF